MNNSFNRIAKAKGQQLVDNAFALKGRKRHFIRKEERELKKINEFFDNFCDKFAEVLLGVPFDDETAIFEIEGEKVKAQDLDPFNDYNNEWLKYCAWYNKQKTHLLKCDLNAFHEWGIDNTKNNSNDIPFNFGNSQLLPL